MEKQTARKCVTIVYLDAMFFKAGQDGKISSKALYNVMGINQVGHKDILEFYACKSEGSHFWLTVLNDSKARGVQVILIAAIDGLKEFVEVIASAFPQTEVQLRNSMKHVGSKHQKEFMIDLKSIYQAESKDLGEYNLLRLNERKGRKYPMVIKSWQQNWENLYYQFNRRVT